MDEKGLERARARLEQEKEAVARQMVEHGVDNVDTDEGFADSAQATTERSELLTLIERLRSHRDEVDHALRKLDEGTYGRCDNCGGPIPDERLEAIPAARLCVECAGRSQGR